MSKRIVSTIFDNDDNFYEHKIRPSNFSEYIGQKQIVENLKIAVYAAKERKDNLDHVLLFGPPGLGKTTLAQVIANELGSTFKATSGPALERVGDLAAILTNLEEGQVFFIDEVHRMPASVEEILYPAMEDFKLDMVIGKGPAARSIRIDLPRFTLIGATTRAGLVSSPLRARFGIVHRLDFYDFDDIVRIIKRSARIIDISIEEEGALEIARRSRGTPRVANRLLKRVRDFAQVKSNGVVTKKLAIEALEQLGVDEKGLDEIDRKILRVLIDMYGGGPAGINALASGVGEDKRTIEEVCEPYLVRIGFIKRTPKGRVATPEAYRHLGYEYKAQKPKKKSLFGDF